MPSPTKPEEYQNLSIGEFFDIAKWLTKLIFSINPLYSSLYLVSLTFNNLQSIGNSYIVAKIIDSIVTLSQQEGTQIKDIYPLMGVLVGFNVIVTIIRFFRSYSSKSLEIYMRPKIRTVIYSKLHELGIQTLENPEINNKIQRTTTEMWRIPAFFKQTIDVISFAISFVVTLVLILTTAPWAVLIIILIYIPLFMHDKKYRRIAWKFSYETTEGVRRASANATYLMDTSSLQEIFINKAFKFLDYKFTSFNDWFTQKRIDIRKKWFAGLYSLNFLNDLGIYTGYLMVFSKFILKQITVGNVLFQVRLLNKLSADLDRSTSQLNNLFEFAIRMKDTYLLFQTKPAFEKGKLTLPTLNMGPAIKIHKLNFKYPNAEKFALRDINLDIRSNEKVAIVGHNGAGKTTLVKLICKMYLPTEGKIFINNQPLTKLNIDNWYENLGVLFQDFNTYTNLTLRENVTIGKAINKHNEKEIINALERADALNLIDDFEYGLDQILSEKYKGGTRPSTGQWQKIAIARFFYRNAPFVIFDEPTAAIDPVSEYNIFNKIYSFFENKTVLLISHRFSTVRNADRIIVLDKGKIIEKGNHKELMRKNGKYAEAFKLQAEGYATN